MPRYAFHLISIVLVLLCVGCTQVTVYPTAVSGPRLRYQAYYPGYAPYADFYYDGYAYSGPYPYTSLTAYRRHDYTGL